MVYLVVVWTWIFPRSPLGTGIWPYRVSFATRAWIQWYVCDARAFDDELGANSVSIDSQLGNVFTAFSAGLTAGAFVWGVLVDIIGWYSDMVRRCYYFGAD
jgi:MFS family permease